MRCQKSSLLVVLIALLLSACSSFKEVYHFRATEGEQTNYYRVTVKGWTFLTTSQYAAGNYDAEAVDALFGELQGAKVKVDSVALAGHTARTPSGATTTTTTTTTSNESTSNAKLETLTGQSLGNKKFIFFLSANSDFFVNQINTYVTTREMQESIVTLILKDDVAKLQDARASARRDGAGAEALATRLRTIVTDLRAPSDGSVTNGEATSAITKVLKTLAANSNTSAGIDGITNAATGRRWLEDHPNAFNEGVNP